MEDGTIREERSSWGCSQRGLHLSYPTHKMQKPKYGTSQNPRAFTLDLIMKSTYCSTWTLKRPTKCLEEFTPCSLISLLKKPFSKEVVLSSTLSCVGQHHPSHFFVALPPTSWRRQWVLMTSAPAKEGKSQPDGNEPDSWRRKTKVKVLGWNGESGVPGMLTPAWQWRGSEWSGGEWKGRNVYVNLKEQRSLIALTGSIACWKPGEQGPQLCWCRQ